MNNEITLEQLYEMQKQLDARIIKEKGLEGQDLIPNTVLALQVEIAELANEWRGFKHWSNDRKPRYKKECIFCRGDGFTSYGSGAVLSKVEEPCNECNGNGHRSPLLEEYVDSLHFFLSIARQTDIPAEELPTSWEVPQEETTTLLIELITATGLIDNNDHSAFDDAWKLFNQIGMRLGLTWEQIAAAYVEKNKINHERQSNGY